MKKKVTSLLMSLMLSLFVLTACGNNGQEAKEPAENNTQTEESAEKTEETEKADQDADAEEAKEDAEAKDDNASGETTEIVFWHAMGGGQGEALEKLVKQFEEENPNIKVNLQNQGNYGDLNQILVATMQSPQDLPTITQAYPDWMLQFESADLVADLTDMVKGENGIEDYDDILPGVREEIEEDGKIMALPFNKSTEVFWYNKTLFDELGLEVPTNYDELFEVSKKIYDEKGIPGVGFDSLPNYYATYLHNNGEIAMDENLDVASEPSVAAVEYYQNGIKEGYFRIAGTDQYMSGPFANEQVGAYIGSNAGEVYVKDGVEGKFEYAAAPYPAESSVQQGTNIYMFENASEEEKKAAFEFLKFLVSKESQIQFALDTGYMPARTSAVEDSKYKESDSAIAKILADATKNLYSRPLAPGSQQAYNDIGSTLEQILSNPDADIKAELEAFAPQYQSDFADAN